MRPLLFVLAPGGTSTLRLLLLLTAWLLFIVATGATILPVTDVAEGAAAPASAPPPAGFQRLRHQLQADPPVQAHTWPLLRSYYCWPGISLVFSLFHQ